MTTDTTARTAPAPLCLKATGVHICHMTAVDTDCRDVPDEPDHTAAEVLFASAAQASEHPHVDGRIVATITRTVCALGPAGCARRLAEEFGEHPETAAARMRWALTVERELHDVPVFDFAVRVAICAARRGGA